MDTLSFSLEVSPVEDPGTKLGVMFQAGFPLYFREMPAVPKLVNQKNRLHSGPTLFPITEEAGARGLSSTYDVCPTLHNSELLPRPGTV